MANVIVQPAHLLTLSTPGFSLLGLLRTGARETRIDLPSTVLTAPTVNHAVSAGFTTASLLSFFFIADQALTIYTNHPSGSAPDDTIVLAANKELYWSEGSPIALSSILNHDVTALYFSCTLATNLIGRILTS